MAIARVSYTGDGVETDFAVPFPFLNRTHVEVRVEGVLQALTTDYIWLSDSTIQFVTAPASGKLVFFLRVTPNSTRLVDFQDASVLKESDLDTSALQNFYLAQEAFDRADNIRTVEEFADGTDFTAGVTTQLTLAAGVDIIEENITINFDGLTQHNLTWSFAAGVITFTSAIPAGVTNVMVAYETPVTSTVLDGGITTAKLANLSVTEPKLAQAIFNALTTVSPDLLDSVPIADASDSGNKKKATISSILAVANPFVNNFRLTLETGVPVSTADQLAKTEIFLTPKEGNKIALYDGTNWIFLSSAEISTGTLSTTAGLSYDIFAWDNGGTLALEVLAWTDSVTRATALVRQDGVLVKTGDATRRYIGSFYSHTTNQVEDSKAKRHLYNHYNKVERGLERIESTDSWNYTATAWRQANGSTANQVEVIVGWEEHLVEIELIATWITSSIAGINAVSGIGVDSTTVQGATISDNNMNASATDHLTNHASYKGHPGIGRHYFAWLERSTASGTTTWAGDDGGANLYQSGIIGKYTC